MRDWQHEVTAEEAGTRLDRYLQGALSGLTRSQIKKLVSQEMVRVDGEPVKAGHPLREGERIKVTIPPPPAIRPEPEAIPLTIVHEDEVLLVVDKPAGMTVHPGAGRSSGTLVNALLGLKIQLSTVGAPDRPGIVHRLDKGTSGLLVVAKDEDVHRRLSEDLAAREISRCYWAIIWGTLTPETGTITGALARSRADRRKMRVVERGGRDAVTRYRTVWSGDGVSALVLTLETGRTHQIRAHLKHLQRPIFGDPDYGGRTRKTTPLGPGPRDAARRALAGLSRQALHAGFLAFRHPVSGKMLEFESVLPEDIRGAAGELGVPAGIISAGAKEES